ncbi:putative lipoprotein [Hyphomonas polymorpha PS728]|uniref:Putative lipoprotein n=1 Tax=Hyphomonas polymorpha PS728 TaxID=1280954 RepID=A0A062VGS3_9PROT|nr:MULTISPECIES: DUF3576 domain-containing protein [Hyphomonas]KCZ98689.1 putative lipoprotein [Hyphomonas polymorpha PS728]
MIKPILTAAFAGLLLVSGCQSRGKANDGPLVVQSVGASNPYLWRATLDTLSTLPLQSTDPIGGIISYDWKSFPDSPNERVKATVFILDSRLRADGVKVTVHRQVNTEGQWADAAADPETAIQLENKILERARLLRTSQIG